MMKNHLVFFVKSLLIAAMIMPVGGLYSALSILVFSQGAFLLRKKEIPHALTILFFTYVYNLIMFNNVLYVSTVYAAYLTLNIVLAFLHDRFRIILIAAISLFLLFIPYANLDMAIALRLFTILFMTNLIPLLMNLSEAKTKKRDYVSTSFAPWNLFFVFLGPKEIKDRKSQADEQYLLTQQRALKLALSLLILTYGKNMLLHLIDPNIKIWALSPSLGWNFSSAEFYFATKTSMIFVKEFFVVGILGLMKMFYIFGTGVMLANLFGIDLFFVPKDYGVIKTLKQLIYNLYFYYNRVILKLFFLPMKKYGPQMNKGMLKVVCILTGGIFFHAVRDYAYATFYGQNHPADFYQFQDSVIRWGLFNISLISLIFFDGKLQELNWFRLAKKKIGFYGHYFYMLMLLFFAFWINFKIYLPVFIRT